MIRKKLNQYFKRVTFVLIILGSLFSGCAQNELNIERKQLFDYDWKFYLGDTISAKLNEFDDESWHNPDLPHDWSIEGQITEISLGLPDAELNIKSITN